MNTAVTFLLLWLLHPIGVALVQDTFNDMLATGAGGAQTPNPVGSVPSMPPAASSLQTPQTPQTHSTPSTIEPTLPPNPANNEFEQPSRDHNSRPIILFNSFGDFTLLQ
ncbi:MAG: hypothetical protein ACREGA_05140 [Candidatus Saccharimonadales bacterium]